jgi:hypothetical protein
MTEQVIKPEARFSLVAHHCESGKTYKVCTPYIVTDAENYATAEFWFTGTFPEAFKRGDYEIREASDGKFTHIQFYCVDCSPRFGSLKRLPYEYTGGTGYATTPEGERLCYDCAAKRQIVEMKRNGKGALYMYSDNGKPVAVGDWGGAVKYPVKSYIKRSRLHYAVWFSIDGEEWGGTNKGDNDIVRCSRVARRF